jgi:hypothetical protein
VRALFGLGFIDQLIQVWQVLLNPAPPTEFAQLISDWGMAPTTIVEQLRESFLFLIYRKLYRMSLQVNPLFELIQDTDLQKMGERLTAIFGSPVDQKRLQQFISTFLREFTINTVNTSFGLELALHTMHTYLHQQKLAPGQYGKPSVVQAVTGLTAHQRPARNMNQNSSPPVLVEEPPPPPAPELEAIAAKGMFPASLYNYGFHAKERAELDMTDIKTMADSI